MSENELNRVLSNPENLIVSDSLKDRIDFGSEKSNLKNLYESKFSVKSKSFIGRLSSFSKEKETAGKISSFCFYCQEDFLKDLLEINTEDDCTLELAGLKIIGKLETFEVCVVESELQVNISVLEHS